MANHGRKMRFKLDSKRSITVDVRHSIPGVQTNILVQEIRGGSKIMVTAGVTFADGRTIGKIKEYPRGKKSVVINLK